MGARDFHAATLFVLLTRNTPLAKKPKKSKSADKTDSGKLVADNRKAWRELDVLEKFECGIVLQGTEIKSIRTGQVQLGQAYVRVDGDEVFLVGASISEYEKGSWTNHSPTRRRKLLLHKREIHKIRSRIEEKGLTVLPLKLYITKRGWAKLQIGLGRGKKLHDKRQDAKKRDTDREIRRAIKEFNR